MKIAIVVSDPTSGLLQYPVDLALCFRALGHQVCVLTWTSIGQNPDLHQRIQDGQIECVTEPSLAMPFSLTALFRGCLTQATTEFIQSDILVTFGPFTAWQVRKYLKKGGISVSMIAAMGHDNSSLWKPRLGALMLNQYTTHVGALCQLETVRLQKLGVAVEKIELIHNWLDLGRLAYQAERLSHLPRQAFLTGLGLASNRKLVVCLASFQPRKCQSLLITVFAKLASLYTEFDLVLGGKGEELPRCKALAMKLGMETRVHFLGQLVNDDAMSLLSVSDAVVHCSNAETFGYSMVEPLYFEKPTLVTNVGIGYEMKRADIAEVVNPDDEVDLLNGLSRLLAGGAKINDRVSRSRKFVTDNFEVSKIARQVIGLVRHD